MGENHLRSMDKGDHFIRSLTRISCTPSDGLISMSQVSRYGKKRDHGHCGSALAEHRSGGARSGSRTMEWLLLNVVRHPEGLGGAATNSQPERIEKVCEVSEVQDALPAVNPYECPEGGLLDLHRPYGGIPSCSDKSEAQEVPEVLLRRQAFTVPSASIRPCLGPQGFTKILAALGALLRARPIRIQAYLDDILVQSVSHRQAIEDLRETILCLQTHGFSINMGKSHVIPTNRLLHLGAVIDTLKGQVFLSPDRLQSIKDLVVQIRSQRRVPLALLSSLLGKMISCIEVVPWARFHARPLQWFMLPFQRSGRDTSQFKVRVPGDVLMSLRWWKSRNMERGCHFLEQDRITVTTDASLIGWGAHCQDQVIQGSWSRGETKKSINWLELRAARLVLRHFRHCLRDRHVLLLTDNITVKAHINRQGGTRSRGLMAEADRLCRWAERNVISIRAEHIAGIDNVRADWLSRAPLDPAEWRLDPELFKEIVRRFGQPVIDLFASPANHQLPRYFSRSPAPGAEGVNALRLPWPRGLLYAFPPMAILPRVIGRILQTRAQVILVAPYWPRRPWFVDLVRLSVAAPWRIPPDRVSLSQGPVHHLGPQWLHLTAWLLSGDC
ncbi:uncharacterized protein LOC131188700 isoform X1 [Ahaetulla prasina]|uniref:uncharacterized protein LOC131188700 isoform X1 n=1 Tax=Ahaetulla prasina TaxID=499056 RepID=UPI002647D6FA|nr:uncharacterized protein LOC131188700 isoform X1 [Ahaetulla prasina]